MTTPHTVSAARSDNPLGTLTVVPWTIGPTAETPVTPFLMVYSLGDGRDGPEAGEEAMRAALDGMGLSIGERVVDAAVERGTGAHLLVEAQRAVLTMPFMKAQCPVPAEWEAAAKENGHVFLICSVRPWPDAVPGEPVSEQKLKSFVTDDQVVAAAAHVRLPVRRLQG
ncbi:DUF5949 family protein [Streptomyces sp. P9(2023)]|uniref:DUF5949 family protein n=1 Tax=Streptomyces sp. P9(2023) TaxID=3064394 RepID=UPI0028F41BAF|nr:DUF5949 family protein [Streptomyces sp. P9(2023)]MDT9688508.1 DUF5949 family protein [Streptomyces sp. P9(2023)]